MVCSWAEYVPETQYEQCLLWQNKSFLVEILQSSQQTGYEEEEKEKQSKREFGHQCDWDRQPLSEVDKKYKRYERYLKDRMGGISVASSAGSACSACSACSANSASVSVVVSDLSSPRCKVRCALLVDNVLPQLELGVLN